VFGIRGGTLAIEQQAKALIGAIMESETANETPRRAGDECGFVAALRGRDSPCREQFVRRFGGQMLATARRFLHRDEDCADAVQEAFLSAFQAIDRFKGNSTLGTWLHRIVVNVCLMKLRARSRRSEVSIDALLPTFDESGHHAHAVRPWKQPPDEQLLRDETRSLVRRCIDILPDDYRTVLVLRDIEELSTEETAEILGAKPGTVRTRLHRARQALRTLVEPHFS
jgi:RNA polymerase sigma-70 factor, ECF subfamily